MQEHHVVIGAGQVGSLLARELVARGKRVRVVRRSAARVDAGVEVVAGDMANLAFAEKAARGAAVLYDCSNPSYDRWHQDLPGLRRGVLHAAASSGAALVQLDNLYMYGTPSGPMTEATPMAPCSRKGELRARLAEETLAASARGDVRVAVVRASDFYGPDFLRATMFGPHFYDCALRGQSVYGMGDADQPHAYSYGPDVARGMMLIGEASEAPDVWGRVWHLPVAPAESTRAMVDRFATELGHPLRITKVPDWILRAMGLVSPMMREVAEMTYQWRAPFVLDDGAFRARFGVSATPLQQGVAETVRWARAARGVAEAAAA